MVCLWLMTEFPGNVAASDRISWDLAGYMVENRPYPGIWRDRGSDEGDGCSYPQSVSAFCDHRGKCSAASAAEQG